MRQIVIAFRYVKGFYPDGRIHDVNSHALVLFPLFPHSRNRVYFWKA